MHYKWWKLSIFPMFLLLPIYSCCFDSTAISNEIIEVGWTDRRRRKRREKTNHTKKPLVRERSLFIKILTNIRLISGLRTKMLFPRPLVSQCVWYHASPPNATRRQVACVSSSVSLEIRLHVGQITFWFWSKQNLWPQVMLETIFSFITLSMEENRPHLPLRHRLQPY